MFRKRALMANRIKDLRTANDMTLLQLAKRIGVSESTVQRYESGNIKNLKYETMITLSNIFGCSPQYLMGWDDSIPSNPDIHPIGTKRFPVLGSVACGKPIFMAEEKEVYVDATVAIRADFVLIAKGDSMVGARINDGDIVFIRQQPEVENGEIAVVAIDDEATLKRFYRYSDDLIVLRAENPAYKDMEFRPEDHKDIRVLGKAVAFQSDVR